jgi:hypothetical protein
VPDSFTVIHRQVVLSQASPALADWLWNHWFYPEHQTPDHDWAIDIVHTADHNEAPPAADFQKTFDYMGYPVALLERPEFLWLRSSNSVIGISKDQNQTHPHITVQVFGSSFSVILLQLAMTHAFYETGLVPLHAAAVLNQDDSKDDFKDDSKDDSRYHAMVFLGPSGRGKTTTLLRILLQGWQPIAEDWVWLEPKTMILYAWDKAMHLLPNSLELLQQQRPHIATESLEMRTDKYIVPYALLGQRVWQAPLKWVITLERSSEHPEPRWIKANPLETTLALYQATGMPLTKETRQYLGNQMKHILSSVQFHKLQLGFDKSSKVPELPSSARNHLSSSA